MEPIHALVLGAVQGLTEVLPISSSAHLILIPEILHWPESGLTFDVALHLGTLVALAAYFWQDIVDLLYHFFAGLTGKGFQTPESRLPLYILAGTVPAAIAGKTLEGPVEDFFRGTPLLIVSLMIAFGLLLALADTVSAKRCKLDRMDLKNALTVGLAQCLALMPGVSRSGITITAALLLGYNREAAARFSFLLSLPIVAGAGILKVGKLLKTGIPAGEGMPLLIGIASSAIFGYLSVALLLRLVQRHTLYPFVWYRLLAGAGFIVYLLGVR